MEDEAAKVLNRPIGSRVLSEADQLEGYLAVRDNPEELVSHLEELINQYGDKNRGRIAFIAWIEKMEKRYNADFMSKVIDIEPPELAGGE